MANKRKDLKIEGTNLWYLVGLITSDGCLSSDGRHIDITSKEEEFLEKIKILLGLVNKIGIKNKGKVNQAYYLAEECSNSYIGWRKSNTINPCEVCA
ncbi:MAG: LAGLIDADG family homing endonuclease [Candidatus Omnitrophota bacterium]